MSHKKLLILGATGGTGQQLVTQALDAGHTVMAFVRDPTKIPVRHERFHVVTGTVTDEGPLLAEAVRGKDAVISVLGRGQSLKSERLIQQSVPPLLAALKGEGVRRLIFASAIGVAGSFRDAPWFSKIIIRLLLRDIYADKAIGEELIRQSDLDWTLVHPAQLTDGPLTRQYRAGVGLRLTGIPKISRADTAHFILTQLDNTAYVRRVVTVGY